MLEGLAEDGKLRRQGVYYCLADMVGAWDPYERVQDVELRAIIISPPVFLDDMRPAADRAFIYDRQPVVQALPAYFITVLDKHTLVPTLFLRFAFKSYNKSHLVNWNVRLDKPKKTFRSTKTVLNGYFRPIAHPDECYESDPYLNWEPSVQNGCCLYRIHHIGIGMLSEILSRRQLVTTSDQGAVQRVYKLLENANQFAEHRQLVTDCGASVFRDTLKLAVAMVTKNGVDHPRSF